MRRTSVVKRYAVVLGLILISVTQTVPAFAVLEGPCETINQVGGSSNPAFGCPDEPDPMPMSFDWCSGTINATCFKSGVGMFDCKVSIGSNGWGCSPVTV